MLTHELIEKCSNSNEILFSEFIHDLSKISYIFDSEKLTFSDIELIRKIVRKYILALLMKNNLKYLFFSKLQKQSLLLIMKNYLISELGLILESLKHYQNKNINDNILYQELEYVINKTENKIKLIQNKNISSPYKVFRATD